MSRRKLTVQLARNVCYLTGTVNGEECVWQMIDVGIWQTSAARAEDDIYRLRLQTVADNGQTYTLETTVYYGLHLVCDRRRADVQRLQELMKRGWGNLTADERAEWLAESHKGAYNYTDLNRVGAAINYVAERLCEWGYPYHPNMRTNWQAEDLFWQSDLEEYLQAVENLRRRLAVRADTPETPQRISTVDEANAIEKIIEDVYGLLNNMIAGLPYSGTIFCGGYPL